MPKPMPSPSIARLCDVLHDEEAACRALLDTIHEERAAIRTLAITEFHPINCRRLAILESLQALADTRVRLVAEAARAQGLPLDTGTLQQLIDRLDPAQAAGLRPRYHAYIATAKTVRAEITQNVVLIEGIRAVVDRALSPDSAGVGRDLYTPQGYASAASAANVLIQQRG